MTNIRPRFIQSSVVASGDLTNSFLWRAATNVVLRKPLQLFILIQTNSLKSSTTFFFYISKNKVSTVCVKECMHAFAMRETPHANFPAEVMTCTTAGKYQHSFYTTGSKTATVHVSSRRSRPAVEFTPNARLLKPMWHFTQLKRFYADVNFMCSCSSVIITIFYRVGNLQM